jgi:hypothetical protein
MTIDELTGCVRDALRINALGAAQMAARLLTRANGNSENLLIAALEAARGLAQEISEVQSAPSLRRPPTSG